MTYRLVIDGDGHEKTAWSLFVQSQFPSYERFWLKHIVPLTNRPAGIHFKDAATLAVEGKTEEDITIAQLHYTVLKHLLAVHQVKQVQTVDDFALFVGLSCLTGAQDVSFELLQRYTNRGKYDPWVEVESEGSEGATVRTGRAGRLEEGRQLSPPTYSGLPEQVDAWSHSSRDRRCQGVRLPAISLVDKYCDWRNVTDPKKAAVIPPGDFEYAATILESGWDETLRYLEARWQQHLLP